LDERIALWRSTLQMFYESKRPNYIGPFKKAGLSQIVIDRHFMTTKGEPIKPDIVSSGSTGWIAGSVAFDGGAPMVVQSWW
jgi:hypothetical protein